MNKAVLDTDIVSEITNGVNSTVAAHATAYRTAFARYTISVIPLMEVIRGYQKKQASRQLQTSLAAMASDEVIPLDRAAVESNASNRLATRSRWSAGGNDPAASGDLGGSSTTAPF